MYFKQVFVGGLENFAYVIGDNGECVLIDPSYNYKKVLEAAKGYKIKYVIYTHAHFDHVDGIKHFKKHKIVMHEYENHECGIKVKDGDILEVGKLRLKIIHTPGHSPGSICILVENKLITGDTLFVGGIGRTDLEGGNEKDMVESLKKLMKLSDNVEVWPCHDYGTKKSSTIGYEKKHNPFLQGLME